MKILRHPEFFHHQPRFRRMLLGRNIPGRRCLCGFGHHQFDGWQIFLPIHRTSRLRYRRLLWSKGLRQLVHGGCRRRNLHHLLPLPLNESRSVGCVEIPHSQHNQKNPNTHTNQHLLFFHTAFHSSFLGARGSALAPPQRLISSFDLHFLSAIPRLFLLPIFSLSLPHLPPPQHLPQKPIHLTQTHKSHAKLFSLSEKKFLRIRFAFGIPSYVGAF